MTHELLLLKLDVDFDSDLGDESCKLFYVYITVFVGTSLDDLLDLVECLDTSQRRLSFNRLLIITLHELAENQSLNAFLNMQRVSNIFY